MSEINEVRNQRKVNERKLLKCDNVLGLGIGFKETEGKQTDKLAVRVYVNKKTPIHKILKNSQVPQWLGRNKQIPTDVVELGDVRIQPNVMPQKTKLKKFLDKINIFGTDRLAKHRPLIPGTSTGNRTITAGTLGAAVIWKGELCSLSNAHVYCSDVLAPLKDQDPVILQPGKHDGGTDEDRKGNLITFGQLSKTNTCYYDVAVDKLDAGVEIHNCAAGLRSAPQGYLKTIDETLIGTKVVKSGRTTGVTTGVVTDVDVAIRVNYGTDKNGKPIYVTFARQILFTGMSKGGDSGSLILRDSDMKAVALLFAGSDTITVGSPMWDIVSDFGITLLSDDNGKTKTVTVNFRLIRENGEDTWTIEGQVTDSSTGNPIGGALISITGDAQVDGKWEPILVKQAHTDSNGEFSISEISGGEYHISCSKEGYAVQGKELVI